MQNKASISEMAAAAMGVRLKELLPLLGTSTDVLESNLNNYLIRPLVQEYVDKIEALKDQIERQKRLEMSFRREIEGYAVQLAKRTFPVNDTWNDKTSFPSFIEDPHSDFNETAPVLVFLSNGEMEVATLERFKDIDLPDLPEKYKWRGAPPECFDITKMVVAWKMLPIPPDLQHKTLAQAVQEVKSIGKKPTDLQQK
ncbi:MAG: hypothetical protein M1300_10765 [Epsilonproteobacteria bacterium]|nr:hypothetical protein [Campylobacterota bacterium]